MYGMLKRNFQLLHNKFGRVGYVNLTYAKECADSIKRVKDARRMADGCSIDHRSTANYGWLWMVRDLRFKIQKRLA